MTVSPSESSIIRQKVMEAELEAGTKLLDADLQQKVKTFKRRWFILFIYITYAALGSLQWISYSSITNLVMEYYDVSSMEVDWTSILYMAVYPVFVIPASYVIDKEGVRTAGVLGCTGTFIGTAVKIFSLRSDRFFVVFCGQTILAASQVLIACLPPKLAALWFDANEVSLACSLGVFGSQLGVALGYIVPPIIVNNHDGVENIGTGLYNLCWLLTLAMVPVTLAVIFYFPNQPPHPPTVTQANIRESKEKFSSKTFFSSLKVLFFNKGFVILMVGYGINIGVYSGVSTLLNQFVLQYFEDADEDVGMMGFVMVATGLVGAILFGLLLDKTHKYMTITMVIYSSSILSMVIFMYALEYRSKVMTYVACALVGLFTTAYMPVGFEFAMELTFPAEESTTTGLLMAMTQIFGVICTLTLGFLNMELGCFWALTSQSLLLAIGALITCFVPTDVLLRQEALQQTTDGMGRRPSHHRSRLVFIQ